MLVTKKTTLLLIMRGRGTSELRKKQFYKVKTKTTSSNDVLLAILLMILMRGWIMSKLGTCCADHDSTLPAAETTRL